MAALLLVLTITLPWLGALGVLLAGDRRPRVQHVIAVASSVSAGLAALALAPFTTDAAVLRLPAGGVFGDFTFVPDGLGVFMAQIATVIGSLAVIFSIDYMRREAQLGRYYALVLLFIGSMAGLVLTHSLLVLFVFWEMVAFCSYALIAFHNDDPKAVAGGIRALVMTQLGGLGLLAGVLVARVGLGTYDLDMFLNRAPELAPGTLALVAFGFLLAAAAKSAQVPFHTWLPGAMEAPTPVSALIHAATMVNAGVYLLARFYPAFAPVPGWTGAVLAVGVLSALLASCMALVCTDIKRVLAYSTVSQLGFMVAAVGLGAVYAAQLHLLSHAVFKALLFLGAGAVIHAVGTRDVRQMGALGRSMPFVRNTFVVGALALAGIPVTNGFWSKDLILEAAWEGGFEWALAGLLLAVGLTALYSFRLVWLVFYGRPAVRRAPHDAPAAMRIALLPLALGTLTTWLLAGPLASFLLVGRGIAPDAPRSTETILLGVAQSSIALVALGIVVLGLATWWWRERLGTLSSALRPVAAAASADFGFEWLNRVVVAGAAASGEALRRTQTGWVNWNLAGVAAGLFFVVGFVALGAAR